MTNKKSTQITIETHSLTIIRTRRNGKTNFVHCRYCQKDVASFRAANAAMIFRVETSELERLFQIKLIHTADNDALCGNSLAEFFKREIRYVED